MARLRKHSLYTRSTDSGSDSLDEDLACRLLFLGAGSVGKTSIIQVRGLILEFHSLILHNTEISARSFQDTRRQADRADPARDVLGQPQVRLRRRHHECQPQHRGHRRELLPELPRHVRDLHQGGGRGAPGLQCGGVRVSRIYLGPERNHPLQTAGHAHPHRGQQDGGHDGGDRPVLEGDGGHRLSGLGGWLR